MGITYYSIYKNSSGNVGVGTISPTVPLDVQCDTGGTGIKIRGRADNSTALRFYANNATTQQAYIGTDDSNIDFLSVATRPIRFFVNSLIQYQINQLGVFSWYDGAGGTRMTLNSSGLGIGTSSPAQLLHVYTTTANDAGGFIKYENGSTGTGSATNAQLIGKSKYGTLQYMVWESNGARIGMRSTDNSGAGDLYFTAGTDSVKMFVGSSGNVGIGTTSPGTLLHLQSSAATTTLRIDNTNSDNDAAILLTDNNSPTGEGLKITYDSSVGDTYFNNIYTGSTRAFNFQKGNFGSGTDLLTILNNGNVGIGTTSPIEKLHVLGNVHIQSESDSIGGGGLYLGVSNSRNLTIRQTSTNKNFAFDTYNASDGWNTRVTILNNGGNVGIGTTSPGAKLQTYATNTGAQFLMSGADGVNSLNFGLGFSVNSQTFATIAGYYTNSAGSGSGDLTFYTKTISTSLSEKMRIQADGNVGIGTSSPSHLLTVYAASAAQFTLSNATRNFVLTNNAADNLLSFNYASVNRLQFNTTNQWFNTGNVGIGTETPGAKLDVSGVIRGDAGADYPHSFTNTNAGNTHWTDRSGRLLTSNGTNWANDGRDPIMALVTSGNSNATTIANSIGLTLHNESTTDNTFSPAILFSNKSNSNSYNTAYAAIIGKKTGQGVDANWSAGELHFYTMPVGAYVQNVPSMLINSAGNVGIGTTDFSYTINDNSRVVGSNTNNRLFVNGSIQLLGNNDAIVFGRGTSTFLTDEELGFGWGGGWYMTDGTYLRVRNDKTLYSAGEIWGAVFKDSNNSAYYINPAGNSIVNSLTFDSNITIYKYNDRNLLVKGTGNSDAGILGRGAADQFAFQLYGSGNGDYGFLNGAWAGWDIKKAVSGNLYLNDNNSYYLNPASLTNLLSLTVANTITGSITGNAGGSSASCTGNAASATYARRLDDASRSSFTVGGNKDNYYPVIFNIGSGATALQYSEFVIERGGYEEPGYTFAGGNTFSTLNIRFSCKSNGWGYGASYENVEMHGYTTQLVANWQQMSEASKLIVWLRGATIYYFWNVVANTTLHDGNSGGTSLTLVNAPYYSYTYAPTATVQTKALYGKYVNSSSATSGLYVAGNVLAEGIFTGPGTGLTGTATSLSIGGSSASCAGNAATATNVAWSGITSKPTTLSGFGITDALPLAGGTMTGGLTVTNLFGNANSASLYANNASYGSWRIGGTRNGWYGIEFESGSNLMMNSDQVGFHRNGYGWQLWWSAGTAYCLKGNPGGGTQATILDSSNQSYAWAMNQNVTTGSSPTFVTVSGTSINIAGNGAGYDTYGTIGVTEPAGASNYSYYGLTRQSNIGCGFGLTGTTGALGLGANAFWFGSATSTAAGVMGSAYVAFNGSSLVAVGTVDATQFRDRDDTTYYLDPAGTSNLNKFSTFTMSYNDMNSMHVNSPYVSRYGGSAYYRNGTMGYGNTDCNYIFSNWGSGFIDSWGSPANGPGSSSHYVGFQGFHYNHQNNVNAYGFQMLCAGEADNRFFWRSAWPTLRSWVEMIHTGNIASQTVTSCTGTAGSISGFNNPTTAATANTIVYRDSGGDISTRYFLGSYVNSTDDTGSTGLTYIMAKFGNDYHRSASADKVAAFISGQTMNINGSSTSCSGSAASAGALNTSNDYTVASLTSNGFVYSGSSAGSTGAFYFNSSSHGIRRASSTNDVYCYTTSGTLYLGAGGSSTTHIRVLSGGDVGIGVSPSYKLDVNGNIHATAFPTSSDIRFKKNITPLENSLEKIKKLQGVKYEWNEFVNSVRDGYKLNVPIIGLIAQDVEKIVPEVVDLWKLSEDCQDARSIDYPRLTPLLIEAIKEQQIIIENQNQKIENLIARMSALEAK